MDIYDTIFNWLEPQILEKREIRVMHLCATYREFLSDLKRQKIVFENGSLYGTFQLSFSELSHLSVRDSTQDSLTVGVPCLNLAALTLVAGTS